MQFFSIFYFDLRKLLENWEINFKSRLSSWNWHHKLINILSMKMKTQEYYQQKFCWTELIRIIILIPTEMIPRNICCKKSFWINRNGLKHAFRLMDFPEFAIDHESQWECQFFISEILGYHNHGWAKNLHFKLFLYDLRKKFTHFFISNSIFLVRPLVT